MIKSWQNSLLILIGLGAIAFPNTVFSQSINQQIVNTHNQWRQKVGSPPLRWSQELAGVAQDWANHLANQGGNISHRPNNRYGENIFWTSGKATPGEAVNAWGSEIKYFKNGTFPNVSTTGNWSDVGHYTQVIWKNTTEVGCGVARSNQGEIWVCNYNPPGNYQGQNPLGSADNPRNYSTNPNQQSNQTTSVSSNPQSNCQGQAILQAKTCQGDGLNSEEKKLHQLINQYRIQNGLPPIPNSPSLNLVANRHVRDLEENIGSLTHSWSDCPFDYNNKATCMWKAPQRLGTPYQGYGYENAFGGSGGYRVDATSALQGWQNSSAHNAVILNQGMWNNLQWKALGIGIYKGYAVLWFGEQPDPANYTNRSNNRHSSRNRQNEF